MAPSPKAEEPPRGWKSLGEHCKDVLGEPLRCIRCVRPAVWRRFPEGVVATQVCKYCQPYEAPTASAPTPPPKREHRWTDRYCAMKGGRLLCVDCGAPENDGVRAEECNPREGWREQEEDMITAGQRSDDDYHRDIISRLAPKPRPEPYAGTLNGSSALGCGLRGRR
jgi:hypothetical protein